MTSEPTVWALGAKNINANKAVGWDEPFPNFADPDVLIVNLESLDSKTLERVDRAKILKAKEDIFDKFSHSAGNIIFITSHVQSYKVYNNKDLSPISFNVVPVQEGSNIKVENGHPFSQYLSKVGRFSFYLEQFDIALEIISKLKRNKNELFLETLPNQTARDNAGHVLSISFKVISHPATTKYSSGQIAFLPPCKDISTEEAINDIIEVFKKKESKETPPEWTSLIDLPGLKNVNDEIAQLNSTKASIEAQISTSQMKKETLEAHSRLLYATGTALEDSVYNAFKLIGLDDITRLREKNKEDWVFKFQTANEFEYGIIEVKGVDARTTLGHLTQTNKWTDEYFENNKKVSKAIFVPNQHRSAKYPDSKEKRIHFEPNELEYARMKHVCILPSCVIFEAVHEHLEGKIRTRAEMEKKIAQASGLITDL